MSDEQIQKVLEQNNEVGDYHLESVVQNARFPCRPDETRYEQKRARTGMINTQMMHTAGD